jgi:SAM-dependent methyltransferase
MKEVDESRDAIAEQISLIRYIEQKGDYREGEWNRNMLEYFREFNGLSKLFRYVHQLDTGGLVLDIGAGTTRGIAEIAKSKLGEGLNFKATVLTRNPKIANGLGFENTHITSAAVLRGIDYHSVSAVLSLNGVAYTVETPVVAKRIDQVLVPGGVIKATFRSKIAPPTFRAIRNAFNTHNVLSYDLEDLGYDVAVLDEELQEAYARPREVGANEDVMLAIKPGGKVGRTARELLASDSGMIDIIMSMDGHY